MLRVGVEKNSAGSVNMIIRKGDRRKRKTAQQGAGEGTALMHLFISLSKNSGIGASLQSRWWLTTTKM